MPIKIEGNVQDGTAAFREEIVRHLMSLAQQVSDGKRVIRYISIEEDVPNYSGVHTQIFLTLSPSTATEKAEDGYQAKLDALVDQARHDTPIPER